jgi:hypothetical protein
MSEIRGRGLPFSGRLGSAWLRNSGGMGAAGAAPLRLRPASGEGAAGNCGSAVTGVVADCASAAGSANKGVPWAKARANATSVNNCNKCFMYSLRLCKRRIICSTDILTNSALLQLRELLSRSLSNAAIPAFALRRLPRTLCNQVRHQLCCSVSEHASSQTFGSGPRLSNFFHRNTREVRSTLTLVSSAGTIGELFN